MTATPLPGRTNRSEIASISPVAGEPYEMSPKPVFVCDSDACSSSSLHFCMSHLSLFRLTDEARFLWGHLPVNLKKSDKRSVKAPCLNNSTAIPPLRSARIQKCAVAGGKDTPTDYAKKQLAHKRTACAIFFGTTFVPVCHTHANANLTRLERWNRRIA